MRKVCNKPLAIALVIASFALSLGVLQRVEPPGVELRRLTIPTFETPPGPYFFAVSAGEEVSHRVLVHELGDSISEARRADILFYGNSRMPLGLREQVIVPAAEALGLRVFSLACGFADHTPFALELIRRHDLKPKVVVASGGPHIFTPEPMSSMAQQALGMDRWQARRSWLEFAGSWALKSRLHRFIPRLDLFGQSLVSEWVIYRSARTGWWRPAVEPTRRVPVAFAEEDSSYRYLLPLARELKAELDARGTLLVLTIVPYGETRVGHLAELSRTLGVPVVVPGMDGMFTADGSHLERESALRLSRDFWQKLTEQPEVRRALALDGG